MHSMRAPSGAFLSCRTSQFTRVVGRPSRGASTSTWQVTVLARRSAVTTRCADGVGDADGAGQLTPVAGRAAGSAPAVRRPGSASLLAGQDRDDLGAELTAELEAGEAQQGVEAGDDRRRCPCRSARRVPAATASRTPIQDSPMSSNSRAPDLRVCSR